MILLRATTEFLEAAGDQVQVSEDNTLWVTPKGIKGQIQLHRITGFGKQRIEER